MVGIVVLYLGPMNQRVTIDISLRSILKVIGVLLGLWLLYRIHDIVLLLFVVIIIVMALAPIVDKWQKFMPRALAVGLLFALILGFLSLVISLLIPPLIDQVSDLAISLPQYTDRLQSVLSSLSALQPEGLTITERALQALSEQLSRLSSGLLHTTLGILGGFVTFFTAIVLSIYLLFEEQGIRNFAISLLPIHHKHQIVKAINKVGDKLGGWLRSQLLLMVIIGLVTGIWTAILGLPYALTLGLWAGLTEVIPFLGPILGGIPIVLLALVDSPFKAIIAVILIALVQQIEANFLVPKIMQKTIGLSPVIVIIALLIGGKLFGIAGTILSVPLAAAISAILQEWPRYSRTLAKSEAEGLANGN